MAQNIPLLVIITQLMFLSCRGIEFAPDSALYASAMVDKQWDILLDIASVDMTNGNVTELCTTEAFYGDLAMADGISAFDSKNQVYYMATNTVPGPLLYAADVANSVALTPLNLYIYGFSCLAVRPANSEVFALLMSTSSSWGLWVLSYPLADVTKFALPTESYDFFFPSTFDNNDTLITFARKSGSSTTYMLFMNPNTGTVMSTVTISGCASFLFTNIKYDESDNMLYGGATDETQSITYDWVKIDPKTGDCSSNVVPTDKGIITAWSYDPNGRNVWYSEEINGGYLLNSVNVDTNKHWVTNTNVLLETIEIDPTPSK